jgi:hypothetical protein
MKNCQNLNSTYFELVNLIVKLNLLTRKTTDKTQHGSSANFSNTLFI